MRTLDVNRVSANAAALAKQFESRIVSQQDATTALVRVIEKWQGGFYDKKRPIASVMFLGPTGTGKTATVEAFSEGLYGYSDHFIKVDCGEFQHDQELSRLVGSPPGYLGHKDTKPFFSNTRLQEFHTEKYPFTVVLWDEIEKANNALWMLMLGVLDKGDLTTGKNEIVDFRKTIHIMTSNVGSAELDANNGLGFSGGPVKIPHARQKTIALSAARRKFLPEFLNRLDSIVMFKTLTLDDARKVLDFEIDKVQRRVYLHCNVPFDFEVTPAAKAKLLTEGYSPKDNARQMRRTVEKYIETPLSNLVATSQINRLDLVTIDYKNDWRFVATEVTVKGSLSSGQVEVPKSVLPESSGAAPSPRQARKSERTRRTKQPADPVLEMS